MFTTPFRRVASSTPSTTPCLTHLTVTTQAVRSRSHQRRFSSSKAASPPADGPNGVTETVSLGRPEAEKKVEADKKVKSGRSKKAVKEEVEPKQKPANHLPSVPSTQHILPSRKYSSRLLQMATSSRKEC